MRFCDVILCNVCMQTRALYAPFESDLRSSSSDVYYHEMPGGQYTNLKFQVSVLPHSMLLHQLAFGCGALAACNYYFDNTAKVTDATRLHSLSDAVVERFRHNGWYVNSIDIGQQPMHETRYRMWEAVLKERDERFMPIRFNREGCEALLVSMQQTKTRQGKNGFEKDKRTELNSSVKPQDAPHLGDALDTLYIGKYKHDYGYADPVTEMLFT